MDLQKKKTFSIITAVASIVLAIAGYVLISLLAVMNDGGTPISFMAQVNRLIEFFNGIAGASGPSYYIDYIPTMVVVLLYLVTFVSGIAFIVALIVDVTNKDAEKGTKRITANSIRLGYTLVMFFALLIFFTYSGGITTIAIGSYLAFAIGAAIVVLACVHFCLTSDKPLVNKIVRSCLAVVGVAASTFVLMPSFMDGAVSMTPFVGILSVLSALLSGGTPSEGFAILCSVLFTFFVVASSFAYSVGCASIAVGFRGKEKKEVAAKSGLMIALSVVAAILVAIPLFGGSILRQFFGVTPVYTMYVYVAFGLLCAMVVISIVVAILARNEKPKEDAPVAEPQEVAIESEPMPEEEPKPEVEPEPAPEEENKEVVEEAAAVVVASEAIADEPAEEPAPAEVAEEPQPEEAPVEEAPAEEAPVEEEPKAEEAPVEAEEKPAEEPKSAKKPAAKKPAEKKPAEDKPKAAKKEPTKKEAAKEEKPAAKKTNASYHISKRASDNKWQVFRAGSDKVIKLFDTKVEAEEYTKRMAENQGVSYLSHASKGKNKGKIQKK